MKSKLLIKLVISWLLTGIAGATLWLAAYVCVANLEYAVAYRLRLSGDQTVPVAVEHVRAIFGPGSEWAVYVPCCLIALVCLAGAFMEKQGRRVSKTAVLVGITTVVLILVFGSVAALSILLFSPI